LSPLAPSQDTERPKGERVCPPPKVGASLDHDPPLGGGLSPSETTTAFHTGSTSPPPPPFFCLSGVGVKLLPKTKLENI
jgi:hypothetical protein